MLIKESLDTLDPEASLPTLTVTQNDQVITDVYRAGYEWRYFATVERRAPQVTEATCRWCPWTWPRRARIALNFSSDPSSLHVYRTESQASPNYLELVNEEPVRLLRPHNARRLCVQGDRRVGLARRDPVLLLRAHRPARGVTGRHFSKGLQKRRRPREAGVLFF